MNKTSDDLASCLTAAMNCLLSNRGPQGHWGDVRSTALAVWAFDEVVSSRNVRHDALPELRKAISDARAWLIGQARGEDGGVSWESEAWDTALAIIALCPVMQKGDRVDQGVAWLQQIRDETDAWYGEVWETTLVTAAILRTERTRQGPAQAVGKWLKPVLQWYLKIPSNATGEFICPHYCGFLAWLSGEIQQTKSATQLQNTEIFAAFREKANLAVQFLLRTAAEKQAWSSYTFSNAYIAYGLWVLSRSTPLQSTYADALVTWMLEKQGRSGGFEDIEDTALAVIALSAMADATGYGSDIIERASHAIPQSSRSHRCFFGYSGKSRTLAIEIKESLLRRLPSIEIKDWHWDFQPGQILISEIESASQVCDVAVFLVTKDDILIQTSGNVADSPRDNIIFEIGYFAARLGIKYTLLVVEAGAKTPSDWGGLLHIPLHDRNNLADVNLKLYDTLKDRLRA